jgi:tetratricopeptide (TPR) repeat protein
MSAYVLPNIILFAAVLGLVAIVARRLPEARRRVSVEKLQSGSGQARFWFVAKGWLRRGWRFILEAKGLHSPAGNASRMRQLLVQNQRKTKAKQTAGKTPAVPKLAVPEQASFPVVTSPPVAVSVEAISDAVSGALTQLHESMDLAKQYLDKKQYFEARKLLESLGQAAHTNPVFWARLGYAQYHLAAYGEAVRCYEKSLGLDSNQPNRYYNLALAHEAAGNRVKALANLEKAIRQSPGNAKYLQTLEALSS